MATTDDGHIDFNRVRSGFLIVGDRLPAQIARQRDKYRRHAQYLGTRAAELAAAKSVEKTQDAIDEINQILQEAEKALLAVTEHLKREFGASLVELVEVADPCWYRNVEDLTALTEDELSDLLDRFEVSDPNDFARYLVRSLPVMVGKKPPDDDYTGAAFVHKLRRILEYLPTQLGLFPRNALELLVEVRMKVTTSTHFRVAHSKYFGDFPQYLDRRIQLMLPKRAPVLQSLRPYRNVAGLWRDLIGRWDGMQVNAASFMRTLDHVGARAHEEVCAKTRLALSNSHLPQELEDKIVEDALLAEQIPAELGQKVGELEQS